ncbi:integrase core domain protein [Lasius niger]|uniref:Integrase core domain protein n=1 Tax=Lasius niger TaxID=67767 RepID=A0A0J7K6D2_LASNI|nr:integrase core domain protein [Lasius niger]
MVGTRSDLAYSIGFLSRSLENPSTEDIIKVKRVFRYIAGTTNIGIVYCPNANNGALDCYNDADFGGCNKTGLSTLGVIVTHAGGAISWLSQRQSMVATSTTEAEIVAANEAAKEIIWLSRLFRSIGKLKHIAILQIDNQAAVKLTQNPEFHRRTQKNFYPIFYLKNFLHQIVTSDEK